MYHFLLLYLLSWESLLHLLYSVGDTCIYSSSSIPYSTTFISLDVRSLLLHPWPQPGEERLGMQLLRFILFFKLHTHFSASECPVLLIVHYQSLGWYKTQHQHSTHHISPRWVLSLQDPLSGHSSTRPSAQGYITSHPTLLPPKYPGVFTAALNVNCTLNPIV